MIKGRRGGEEEGREILHIFLHVVAMFEPVTLYKIT